MKLQKNQIIAQPCLGQALFAVCKGISNPHLPDFE